MKKNKVQLLIFTGVIYLSVILLIQSCSSKDFTKAEVVIKKIEHYKKSHSRLPISLDEIGMDHNTGPVYYDKLNDSHYQMFYVFPSEEIWIYNTIDKKWKYCPECGPLFENK